MYSFPSPSVCNIDTDSLVIKLRLSYQQEDAVLYPVKPIDNQVPKQLLHDSIGYQVTQHSAHEVELDVFI